MKKSIYTLFLLVCFVLTSVSFSSNVLADVEDEVYFQHNAIRVARSVDEKITLSYILPVNSVKMRELNFGEDEISVANVEELNPADFSALIFTENDKTASIFGSKFAKSKVRIINATKAFEGDKNIPMVVGGINETQLDTANKNLEKH